MGKYPTLDKAIQDMESVCPNMSFLGMIPKMEKAENEQQVGLIAHNEPKSGAAEAFRFLRTKFKYLNPDSPSKTVLITSSMPVEGKTIVASNMAIVLANLGNKTLLVDADLRRPSLHKVFNIERKQGLSELLIRDEELNNILTEIVKDTEVENLSLITSGTIPPQSPADLLDSERMRQFIRLLTEQYDYVIFDSPPVKAVVDPMILSLSVDYTIYVFDIAKTKRSNVVGGLEALVEMNPHSPIGVVCNLAKKSGGSKKGYVKYVKKDEGEKK